MRLDDSRESVLARVSENRYRLLPMHVSDRWWASAPIFLVLLGTLACAQASGEEGTIALSILDNGTFDEAHPLERDERGILRIPWWRSPRGVEQIEADAAGTQWLVTAPGELASQPLPCYAPLFDRLEIRGRLRGEGTLTVRDDHGARASFELHGAAAGGEAFTLSAAAIRAAAGGALVPRLELELAATGDAPARWTGLGAQIALPLPSEEQLRAEIVAELERIFDWWLERDLDDAGPLATGLLAWQHDVLTGAHLTRMRVSCHPIFLLIGRALACEEKSAWRAPWERFLVSYFEYGLHPATGVPRNFDCERDQPDDERALEIASVLGFLIDLAEHGEGAWRERARAAAAKLGETILSKGVLPDGTIAARYRPSDGAPNTDVPPLRALDVPAQLARLSKLLGDERFLAAARRAVRRFEYTHYWAGTWEFLDPGFDDHYGHYGDRGLTLWRADPATPSFRRVAEGGLEYYLPRWHDDVRLGGYVAADEVRCWPIATGIAELEPGLRDRIAPVLSAAVRAHFKSEQYPDASWGDVTHYEFDPKSNLEVGDLPAIPQNLLLGLAIVYEADLGPPREEVRAMFTAIVRQTATTFAREYGYLSTRREQSGQNPAGGEIRLATGLVEMLEALR